MSFFDDIKKNTEKKRRDKEKEPFSAAEKKKLYKNKDGSWSKTSIALSVVAIILILMFGGYAMFKFQTKDSLVDDVIKGLSTENAAKAVSEAFYTSLQEYVNGDITYEQLQEAIGGLINDYLEASGGFTETQLAALNEYVTNYLDGTTIYEDINKNSQTINDLSKKISETYESNRAYIEQIDSELKALIEANSALDDERYEELVAMDNRLQSWLNDTAAGLQNNINESKNELTAMLEDLRTLFMNTVGGYTYDATKTYAQGDFVFFEDYMYVSLKDDNTAPLTDKLSWTKTDIKTLMSNMDNKFATAIGAVIYDASTTYSINEYVFDDEGNFYISLKDDNIGNDLSDTTAWQKTDIETIIKGIDTKFTEALGAERWTTDNTYSEGNFVFDDKGNLYVSLKDNNNSDLSDASAWKSTDVETALNDLNKQLQDVINSIIGAKEYVAGNTYKQGDYVIYEGDLYIYQGADGTTADITDASAWKNSSIAAIISEMDNSLAALEIKQGSDLQELNEYLTNIINENANLSAQQKEDMLKLINENQDSSQEALEKLYNDLSAIAGDAMDQDAALKSQLEALNNTVAGDITDLRDETNAALHSLEDAATWSKRVTYDKDAYVTHYNGSVQRFYHSLADNNLAHEPGTDDGAAWWEEVDTVTLINDLQSQVTDNKNHLLDSNGSGAEFQYGVSNGKAGYYVDGTFNAF